MIYVPYEQSALQWSRCSSTMESMGLAPRCRAGQEHINSGLGHQRSSQCIHWRQVHDSVDHDSWYGLLQGIQVSRGEGRSRQLTSQPEASNILVSRSEQYRVVQAECRVITRCMEVHTRPSCSIHNATTPQQPPFFSLHTDRNSPIWMQRQERRLLWPTAEASLTKTGRIHRPREAEEKDQKSCC